MYPAVIVPVVPAMIVVSPSVVMVVPGILTWVADREAAAQDAALRGDGRHHQGGENGEAKLVAEHGLFAFPEWLVAAGDPGRVLAFVPEGQTAINPAAPSVGLGEGAAQEAVLVAGGPELRGGVLVVVAEGEAAIDPPPVPVGLGEHARDEVVARLGDDGHEDQSGRESEGEGVSDHLVFLFPLGEVV